MPRFDTQTSAKRAQCREGRADTCGQYFFVGATRGECLKTMLVHLWVALVAFALAHSSVSLPLPWTLLRQCAAQGTCTTATLHFHTCAIWPLTMNGRHRPCYAPTDVADVWWRVSQLIAQNLVAKKGTRVPNLGTFTLIEKKTGVGVQVGHIGPTDSHLLPLPTTQLPTGTLLFQFLPRADRMCKVCARADARACAFTSALNNSAVHTPLATPRECRKP